MLSLVHMRAIQVLYGVDTAVVLVNYSFAFLTFASLCLLSAWSRANGLFYICCSRVRMLAGLYFTVEQELTEIGRGEIR